MIRDRAIQTEEHPIISARSTWIAILFMGAAVFAALGACQPASWRHVAEYPPKDKRSLDWILKNSQVIPYSTRTEVTVDHVYSGHGVIRVKSEDGQDLIAVMVTEQTDKASGLDDIRLGRTFPVYVAITQVINPEVHDGKLAGVSLSELTRLSGRPLLQIYFRPGIPDSAGKPAHR